MSQVIIALSVAPYLVVVQLDLYMELFPRKIPSQNAAGLYEDYQTAWVYISFELKRARYCSKLSVCGTDSISLCLRIESITSSSKRLATSGGRGLALC